MNKSLESKFYSESVAENAASTFLTNHFGSDIFIGADIEQIIEETTNLIYQDIDDSDYSGASITYRGQHFIVINTHQSLRSRYYSAAHELWHLAMGTDLLGSESKQFQDQASLPNFDTERAADHFAAAIMLPKEAMINTWNKYVKNKAEPNVEVAKQAVIRIANVSSMPYTAVARRLEELNLLLSTQLVKWEEKNWLEYLLSSHFPPSALDQKGNNTFDKFSHFSKVVDRLVSDQQLSLMDAARLLTHSDPSRATYYLDERKKIVAQLEEDSEDE